VANISTTDFSSADIGAALGHGARFAFLDGTQAVLLTDATLSVGPDTNEATIQRLYEGLLGRGNDTAGISTYDAQLNGGASKATIATEIMSSPEYANLHGTPADDQFVTDLYSGLLGRAPDPNETAIWTTELGNGASRGNVAVSIADSDEAKSHLAAATSQVFVPDAAGTLAHELYETGLGREVELGALPAFKTAFETQTPSQLAAAIAASPEFLAEHTGQDNTAYVNSLYQGGVGRIPDPAGLSTWTTALANGSSRSDVLLGVATSPEAATHLTFNLSG
jgi:hypothetical protein